MIYTIVSIFPGNLIYLPPWNYLFIFNKQMQKLRLVSLATNDAIWDWDLVQNKIVWNEAYKTLFGYKDEEVEGKIENKFSKIHSGDKDRIIFQINQFIGSEENQWSGEYRFKCANGRYAYVLDRDYILYDDNRVPYRMLGSMVDLSDLKKTQDELNTTNEKTTTRSC